MNTTTKPGVLAELATMRKRFVACAMHSGSDKEFAEGACASFDEASATLAKLIEVVRKVSEYQGAAGFEAAVLADNRAILRAALAAFNGDER